MATALTLLLIGSLLQGALCGEFQVTMPQTIEVLGGSCVTIPCSFDIQDKFKAELSSTCKALWNIDQNTIVFDSSNPQHNTMKGTLTGDLTKKNCTTTLNNMQPAHSNKYYLRLECISELKYNFHNTILSISVKDDPPRPTLTPSTLKVKEGASVSLVCSAPAPCRTHPPNLTWTPGLGDSQETLLESQDKNEVKTSVVNFTASHRHHGKTISCTATYSKQDGSSESAVSESLTADISFAPHILPSSHCTKSAAQLSCSCKTAGNPSPTLLWFLDEFPVNQTDKFAISYEPLNDTGLSILTVNHPQESDLSTLLCRSSNSLGSISQCYCAHSLSQSQDRVTLLVFITTVSALLVLVCALLFVIRAQKKGQNPSKSQCTGDTSAVTMSQLLTSEKGNQVLNTTEEDIYVNTNIPTQADVALPTTVSEPNSTNLPTSGPDNSEGASKSSEKKNEEDNVIYSHVTWKPKSQKKKRENSGDMLQPGSTCVEEE